MALVPFLALFLGLPAAVGLVVFFWISALGDHGRRTFVRALFWAVMSAGLCWVFLYRVANLLLPDPLILSLF